MPNRSQISNILMLSLLFLFQSHSHLSSFVPVLQLLTMWKHSTQHAEFLVVLLPLPKMNHLLFVFLESSSLPFKFQLKPAFFLFEATIDSSQADLGLFFHTCFDHFIPSFYCRKQIIRGLVSVSVDLEVLLASELIRQHLGNIFNSWPLSNIDE